MFISLRNVFVVILKLNFLEIELGTDQYLKKKHTKI